MKISRQAKIVAKGHKLGNWFWRDAKPSIIGQPYTIVVLGENPVALCPVAGNWVSIGIFQEQ